MKVFEVIEVPYDEAWEVVLRDQVLPDLGLAWDGGVTKPEARDLAKQLNEAYTSWRSNVLFARKHSK